MTNEQGTENPKTLKMPKSSGSKITTDRPSARTDKKDIYDLIKKEKGQLKRINFEYDEFKRSEFKSLLAMHGLDMKTVLTELVDEKIEELRKMKGL